MWSVQAVVIAVARQVPGHTAVCIYVEGDTRLARNTAACFASIRFQASEVLSHHLNCLSRMCVCRYICLVTVALLLMNVLGAHYL